MGLREKLNKHAKKHGVDIDGLPDEIAAAFVLDAMDISNQRLETQNEKFIKCLRYYSTFADAGRKARQCLFDLGLLKKEHLF